MSFRHEISDLSCAELELVFDHHNYAVDATDGLLSIQLLSTLWSSGL